MSWIVRIAKRAEKRLKKFPEKDQRYLLKEINKMTVDPFKGDIVRLSKNQPAAWRRRVGNYRMFYDVDYGNKIIDIAEIVRRTSTTY